MHRQALQFSELRYRRLFETAQDGILILDADTGKIADANPFLQKLLGYSQEELIGKGLWEIGVFKDIVDSQAAFVQLQNKGYIRYRDLPLQAKDGHTIDVEFVSNVYTVASQRVIQCNIRDTTDRKKAELLAESRAKELERLSAAQEETRKAMLNIMEDLETTKTLVEMEKAKDEAMLASLGEGLIAVDNERKIMMINTVALDMLGWDMQDLIGKVITTLPFEDENNNLIPLEKRPAHTALTTGEKTNATYFFMRKDKTRFPIATTATPIKLDGKIIGLIEIIRDVTLETEVDRAKSEFVSLASHQLRTPLGIMKWYLEALAHESYVARAPQIVQDYLQEINKNNERVLTLVRNLLSVSRIDQKQVKNDPKLTNSIHVITEAVARMQIVALKKKITLRLAIHNATISPIFLDTFRFHEVMENLISNAIEYTERSGFVTITVEKEKDALVVDVQDTGMGISDADQKKLFIKFFRGEKAVVHNPEGSGLGLYVVKAYVEGWGGTMSVKSTEGKGTTFTIQLPIVQKKNI